MKSIAILGLKRIGDAIYTLPLIEALKQQGQAQRIVVFTEPQVAAIYEANPFIDDVQVFRKTDFWRHTLMQLKADR
ncbi:MAG: hypothetical protein M1579_06165, partial [Gammaproteobacteria bacterium]|nr:hypothetical protein [Gammaproteobacteria bacterium]